MTESLPQGDGLATPSFDVTYTLIVIKPLTQLFPDVPRDVLVCHDDTTLLAPPWIPPSGSTLREFEKLNSQELTALIKAFAAANASPVYIAQHIRDPPRLAKRTPCGHSGLTRAEPSRQVDAWAPRPSFPLLVRPGAIMLALMESATGQLAAPSQPPPF